MEGNEIGGALEPEASAGYLTADDQQNIPQSSLWLYGAVTILFATSHFSSGLTVIPFKVFTGASNYFQELFRRVINNLPLIQCQLIVKRPGIQFQQ